MISIIGAGGFAREVKAHLLNVNPKEQIEFYVDSEFKTFGLKTIEEIDIKCSLVLIAIANPIIRKRIVENMPIGTKYLTFIHPSAVVLDAKIGEGSVICANCTVTVGVSLGNHCHLSPGVTVGHDTTIGDYFTATPGVNIAGNCNIGSCVYMGTNSCVKQKTNIIENTTVGMGCVVVNNIDISGVYVGNPAKKLR